MDVPAV